MGKKLHGFSPAGREEAREADIAGNGEKLLGMFPAGKAGQAGPGEMLRLELLSGGGEELREVVGIPEESLKKKKNQTSKRTPLPTPIPSHRLQVVENFLFCHTHTSHIDKSTALPPSSRRTGI